MGVRWTIPPTMRFPEMAETFIDQVLLSGKRVAHNYAPQIEEWMKDNAPWTDRPDDERPEGLIHAREGLTAYVDEARGAIGVIRMSYDPDTEYGVWLEFAYQGRWGIIGPALDYWPGRLRAGLQGMANLGLIDWVK